MKKLLYLIPVLFVTSCKVIPSSSFIGSVSYVDYKPYTDKGFFITESNSVNFNYAPLSSVVSINRDGYDNSGEARKEIKHNNDMYGSTSTVREPKKKKKQDFIEANPQNAVQELYKKSIELGANGIINLKIETFIEDGIDKVGRNIKLTGYKASGMAIKR